MWGMETLWQKVKDWELKESSSALELLLSVVNNCDSHAHSPVFLIVACLKEEWTFSILKSKRPSVTFWCCLQMFFCLCCAVSSCIYSLLTLWIKMLRQLLTCFFQHILLEWIFGCHRDQIQRAHTIQVNVPWLTTCSLSLKYFNYPWCNWKCCWMYSVS